MTIRGLGPIFVGMLGVVCCLLQSTTTVRGDESRLQALRQAVRTEEPESPREDKQKEKDKDCKRRGNDWDDPDDDEDDSFLGTALLLGLISPFWCPIAGLQDDYCVDGYFPGFPYDDVPGYLVIGETDVRGTMGLRLSTEVAHNFDDLTRAGGGILFSTSTRWGIDSQWNYLHEEFSPGDFDELWTGDANLVFRFAQSEHAEFRAGLGLNWLHDSADTDVGFNFTYGFDCYPKRPWVISTEIDWGLLGERSLFHGRMTVGVMIQRWELYTGYDYYDVGDVAIDGLIAGLRVWF